jgi:anti-anti-sigma factor
MADFSITSHGPSLFFVGGELDMATVPLLHVAISEAVARGGPIVLDVTDVTFIDSTGVSVILGTVKALPTGCLILHGLHDGARKVFDLIGVGRSEPKLHVIPCEYGGEPALQEQSAIA